MDQNQNDNTHNKPQRMVHFAEEDEIKIYSPYDPVVPYPDNTELIQLQRTNTRRGHVEGEYPNDTAFSPPNTTATSAPLEISRIPHNLENNHFTEQILEPTGCCVIM